MGEIYRPSKEIYYLGIAEAVSKRSTCLRSQCGAIIVKDDVVVSTGYNGSARGKKNCIDLGYCYRVANNIPSGTQYETCLDGDTKIALADGGYELLEKLAKLPDKDLPDVWAYDDIHDKVVRAKPDWARYMKSVLQRRVIHGVNFRISCTPDHRIGVATDTTAIDYLWADRIRKDVALFGAEMTNDGWIYKPFKVLSANNESALSICNAEVYDMCIPEYHNFGIYVEEGQIIFVHNCHSVHGEQNAIINAERQKTIWGTMYVFQKDLVNNCVRVDPGICRLCQRMIINAGLESVVLADPKGMHYDPKAGYGVRVVKVQDWVDTDDESPLG